MIQGVEAPHTQHPCLTPLCPISTAWYPLSPPVICSKGEPVLHRQRAAARPGQPEKAQPAQKKGKMWCLQLLWDAPFSVQQQAGLSSLPMYMCLHPWVGHVQGGSGKVGTPEANPHT